MDFKRVKSENVAILPVNMAGCFSLSVTDYMVALSLKMQSGDRCFLHLLSHHALIPLISKLGHPESGEQHLCSSTTQYFFKAALDRITYTY